jgi:hypothetical protein
MGSPEFEKKRLIVDPERDKSSGAARLGCLIFSVGSKAIPFGSLADHLPRSPA